ncbi:MAG: DUF547 domain-containing protein [Deltaproteobacteria bacterium]|nr:DUF547 domain-containing protein [Deltaproteobacteria bacterium]
MTRTVLLALGLVTAFPAVAACPAFDQAHSRWNTLLHQRVSAGVVDYAALHAAPAQLAAYLDELGAVCKVDFTGWTREQKVAFWVNAYNAFTVKAILDHYPVKSIREIGLLPGAAWREKFIPLGRLAGKSGELSLNDVEHEILRKDFPDARLHFVLVCASMSCPELRDEAYRASQLAAQFDDAGRRFLGDVSKNQLDGSTWKVSSIFKWYRDDFERDGPGLVPFLKRYAGPQAQAEQAPELEFRSYDWSLNGK